MLSKIFVNLAEAKYSIGEVQTFILVTFAPESYKPLIRFFSNIGEDNLPSYPTIIHFAPALAHIIDEIPPTIPLPP